MARSGLIDWIEGILESKGWTQAELARLINPHLKKEIERSIINKVLLGRRELSADEMLAIELVSGIPSPTRREADLIRSIPVPLISWVSAGNLVIPDEVVDLEDAPTVVMPGLDPKGDWIALKVEGDSMDRVSPPESIIFVNRRDKRLVPNACYVIATDDGEATYKRYRDGHFSPVSTNKKHTTLKMKPGQAPKVIGRVRKTLLSM